MKKILFILFGLLFFLLYKNVAHALNIESSNTKYIYQIKSENTNIVKSLVMYKHEDKLLYSLQPDVDFNDVSYDTTIDFGSTGISISEIDYIKKVIYFGYNYKNHTNIEYFLATQELIWECISQYKIDWYLMSNKDGIKVDVENEKEEIKNLILEYDILPSFSDKTFKGGVGTTLVVEDENNVIEKFTSNDENIKIENNSIIINFDQIGYYGSNINKTICDNYNTYLYTTEYTPYNSQKFIYSEGLFPISIYIGYKAVIEQGTLNISTIGDKIVDFDDDFILENKNIPFIKYKIYASEPIYDVNGNLLYKQYQEVLTFETDENGKFSTNLYFGRYYITKADDTGDYVLNQNELGFILEEENPIINVNLKLEYRKYDISFSKYVETLKNEIFSNYIPKEGIEFGIYLNENLYINSNLTLEKNTLIKKYKTDSLGKVNINTLLPLGSYYISEITKLDNYQQNLSKYEFVANSTLKINLGRIINYLERYKVTVHNYDSCGSGLYSEFILYKNDKYIKHVVTNEDGLIVLDGLTNGKYKLIDTYDLSEYEFNINNSDSDIKIISKKTCQNDNSNDEKDDLKNDINEIYDEVNNQENSSNIEEDIEDSQENFTNIGEDIKNNQENSLNIEESKENNQKIEVNQDNVEDKAYDNYLNYEMPETYSCDASSILFLNILIGFIFILLKK